MSQDPKVIGSTVSISFPASDIFKLPAKVDTGADGSSVWATRITEKDGMLEFCLLGPSSPKFSGKVIRTRDYTTVTVRNSFGDSERRYKVRIPVEIEGRRVRATFSLANRKVKSYPALIGRRLLHKRFIVDVSKSN